MGRIESGIGISTSSDLAEAAREASIDARRQCPSPAVVLLLATDNYPAAQLVAACDAIAAAMPTGTPIAGGTIPGVAFGDLRFDSLYGGHAVALLAIGGDGIRGQACLAADAKNDPHAAGRTLAERMIKLLGEPPSAGILLSPSIVAKPRWMDPEIVTGIHAVLPHLPLAGGGVAGGLQLLGEMPEGHAFAGREVAKAGALLVGLTGVDATAGIANGLRAERRAGAITAVRGVNVIEAIDGRPARDVALDLLSGGDPKSRELLMKGVFIACVELGVTFAEQDSGGRAVWPHIPAGWAADGGLIDHYRPRPGGELVIARMNRDACLAAVDDVADMLGAAADAPFELTISFSCSLRGITLGPQRAEEHGRFRSKVQTGTHLGLAMRGEIGSNARGESICTGWSYAAIALRGR